MEYMDRARKILWLIVLAGLAMMAWWLDHSRPFPAHVIRNGPQRAASRSRQNPRGGVLAHLHAVG